MSISAYDRFISKLQGRSVSSDLTDLYIAMTTGPSMSKGGGNISIDSLASVDSLFSTESIIDNTTDGREKLYTAPYNSFRG